MGLLHPIQGASLIRSRIWFRNTFWYVVVSGLQGTTITNYPNILGFRGFESWAAWPILPGLFLLASSLKFRV